MRTQTESHNLLYVGSEIEKFNVNRLLGSFGIIKKDPNDKYNKNIFERYKKNSGVYVWLKVQDFKKVIDAGIVRTYSTLKKLDDQFKTENCAILLHPYAVRIPEGFWLKWKQAKTSQDRINLIKEYNLLKDENVYKIDKIVLDIDTPVEYAQWQLENVIFPELNITEGYEIGRTKSGNTRVILYLKWALKANEEFRKQKHIERLRELYYLLIDYFHYRGHLKLDRTFADRINHPIWFSFNSNFYQRLVSKPGRISFYALYGHLKRIQKRANYWVTRDNLNLTIKFWGDRRPKRKSTKIQLPAFLRNELKRYFDDDYKLTLWKKAVKSLYKGKGNRFINFILPAIGWAKYLNLNRIDVDMYLMQFLSDRDAKKTEKDLDIAWKYADELEFRLPDNKKQVRMPTDLDLIQITEKALNYVKEKSRTRQELLQDIFYRQAWLCDLVMNFLEKKGFVRSEFVKSGKRGRPSKVFHFVDNNTDNIQTKNKNSNQVKNKNRIVDSKNTSNIAVTNVNNNSNNNNDIRRNINSISNSAIDFEQNRSVVYNVNNIVTETNDCSNNNSATVNTEKKSFQYISLSEYVRDIYNSDTNSIHEKPGKYLCIYDPVTKQKVLIELYDFYLYESRRLERLNNYTEIPVEGYRIPTIREPDKDFIFKTLFGKFTFAKQYDRTNTVYLLGPIDLHKYYDEMFVRTGDYRFLHLMPATNLNFSLFQTVSFRYLPQYSAKNIKFIFDLDTLKVYVNPKEFNMFYFSPRNANMYFDKLKNNMYQENSKIKWHTIKDRQYYTKAKKISQNDLLGSTNYWKLLKDKNYWYMQAKQPSYETIPEEQKQQIFSSFRIQLDSSEKMKEKDKYHYTLSESNKYNSVHLTICYNLPSWMPR